DDGGAMTNGGNYARTEARGEGNEYTFQANAGDGIAISASEVGPDTTFQPYLLVFGPTGQLLVNAPGQLYGRGILNAPLTGTYTAVVTRFDTTDGTGQYVLTVAQSAGTLIVSSGDEGGAMTNGGNYA